MTYTGAELYCWGLLGQRNTLLLLDADFRSRAQSLVSFMKVKCAAFPPSIDPLLNALHPSLLREKDLHCCRAATLDVWSEVPNSPRRSGPTEMNQGLRKNRKLRTPTSTILSCWQTFWRTGLFRGESSPTLHTRLSLSNRVDVRCHVVFVSFLLSGLTLKVKRYILLSSLGNAKRFSRRAGCICGEAGRLTVIVSELKDDFWELCSASERFSEVYV